MKKPDEVRVVRVDHTGPTDMKKEDSPKKKEDPPKKKLYSKHKTPKCGVLKHGKTARTKPRFEAVRDPAKAPPSKKSKTLRILTDKGLNIRRKKIADEASKMPISRIRHTLRKQGLPIKDSTPENIVRGIYEDAQGAGMISSG